jgi:hypothetical protein
MRGFDNAGRSFSNNPGALRFPGSEVKRMSQISERLLFWLPRILSIAFVAFIAMFALDVFSESHGFLQTALALSIHLLPAAVLALVLIAAWRWDWVGALLFAVLGGIYAWKTLPAHPSWTFTISLPLFVLAALFLANWILSRHPRPTR